MQLKPHQIQSMVRCAVASHHKENPHGIPHNRPSLRWLKKILQDSGVSLTFQELEGHIECASNVQLHRTYPGPNGEPFPLYHVENYRVSYVGA